ncbi:MAG: type IV secretory system conjugative DNA transfer family protein [Tenericutes bacterium]|nr:type IV secretory system conjugative DNA transfer family protein [Mycoplasmatota bacterium]
MSINIIILLVVLIVFTIGFMYIEPMMAKHKIKSDNEYGSARFSSKSEIEKYFVKERIGHIREAGVPILFSKDLKYMWVDKETPHYVYLGSTGSGKSVTAVIPFCSFIATAKNKRSVFITDPKGEIYNTTSSMFKKNGYNILTIDFRHPELSNKFNILEPIIKEYEKYIEYEKKTKKETDKNKKLEYNNLSMSALAETNRLITSLSTMIMIEKVQGKDPFWNNSAKNLLEGLIGFFLEEYKSGNIRRDQITMTSIRKFQNSSMEEKNLKNFKKYIEQKEYGSKSKDSLTSILSASDNTFKSITAVFGEKMALFDDINVANVTSSNSFDFDILGKEPTALYVIVPDEDKTYYTLVTIIVGLLYRELVKLANSRQEKKLKYQIDWILDEFANCPPLADIEAIVSVARSRGMRFHFFIQSFSQLDNVYGKEVSQIILDNCGIVYLKTNTQETAEAISKRLGKKTIESNSISQSMSLRDYNGNKSTSLIARDLMTPDEVKQLHYKTIIFPIIGYPILRDTIIYKKFSSYSSGEEVRTVNPLIDLSNTYFTVEDIKVKRIDPKSRNSSKDLEPVELEEYDEMLDYDKQCLKEIEEIINKIFGIENIKYDYIKTDSNRVYCSVTVNKKIPQSDKSKVLSQINKFHVEIQNDKDTKTIIEIHNKELDMNHLLELSRGETNNV